MRLAKEIYWVFMQEHKAINVGNIMIPVDGVYLNIDDVPNAYIEEVFGYSKEDFCNMIMDEVDASELEDSLNDI